MSVVKEEGVLSVESNLALLFRLSSGIVEVGGLEVLLSVLLLVSRVVHPDR